MELVSAAREYETPAPRAISGRFRGPALAAVRYGRGGRLTSCACADDDDAQRQGPRVSRRGDGGARGGPVSALAFERRRDRARRGAASLLRGDHPRTAATGVDVGRAPQGIRRIPVNRALRFIDEIPRELVEEIPSTFVSPYQSSFSQFRASPYGRGAQQGTRRIGRRTRTRTRTSRCRKASGQAPGSVTRSSAKEQSISIEPLDDDTKLVVRFSSVGQKTLRAKFAKLEVA